jgi:hypothetical protein
MSDWNDCGDCDDNLRLVSELEDAVKAALVKLASERDKVAKLEEEVRLLKVERACDRIDIARMRSGLEEISNRSGYHPSVNEEIMIARKTLEGVRE